MGKRKEGLPPPIFDENGLPIVVYGEPNDQTIISKVPFATTPKHAEKIREAMRTYNLSFDEAAQQVWKQGIEDNQADKSTR